MVELSIIIVNFETRDLLIGCLNSIEKSDIKTSFEIIVIDNGSSDGSIEGLKEYRKNHEHLTIIENKSNLGFARASNQGIKYAKGNYTLLLNSDTKVKKNAINKLLDFAKKTPDLGAVGPKFLNTDGTIQGSIFRLPTLGRAVREYWLGEKGLLDKYSLEGKNPIPVEALSMACFLITPNCLLKVGFLNERYFMYFEDLDYCRRIKEKGLKTFYFPEVEIYHYHGASGKKLTEENLQWKRLIPSSKIYHGEIVHYLITFIIKSSQICSKLLKRS